MFHIRIDLDTVNLFLKGNVQTDIVSSLYWVAKATSAHFGIPKFELADRKQVRTVCIYAQAFQADLEGNLIGQIVANFN